MHASKKAMAFCALLALGSAPAFAANTAPSPTSIRFSGEVKGNDRFEHRLPGGLRFLLRPGGPEGWSIEILGADSTEDFVGVATPPYRGVNHRVIEAWHFRNAENTGPNKGDVNAPQHERYFSFVMNRTDYAAWREALDRVLWPYAFSDAAVDSARQLLDQPAQGEGRLTIRAMKLGGLKKGTRPWFESMRFDVVLQTPSK